MLIICPDCEASYEVDSADLGAGGRKVRCAECGATWHAAGETRFATLESLAEIEPVPLSAAADVLDEDDDADGFADAPLAVPGQLDIIENQDLAFREPKGSGRQRRKPRGTAPRQNSAARSFGLAAAAGIAALAALGIWRQTIVELIPDLAGLYAAAGMPVNLRGLEFRDVATTETRENGVPLLVVRGAIENITGSPVEVPRLRLSVRGVSGREIYVWTAVPSKAELEPGEALPFFAQLASPPAEGREVAVRFISTRDTSQNLAAR